MGQISPPSARRGSTAGAADSSWRVESGVEDPVAITVATGYAGHLPGFLFAFANGELGGELPASLTAGSKVARRRKTVGHTGHFGLPDHSRFHAGQFERVPHAGSIALVNLVADLGADDCTDRRAEHDRRWALVFVGARPDHAADCAAEHGAHRRRITSALNDAVVVVPLLPRVADIAGIIHLAPAMRFGMRWRLGEHGDWQQTRADKRNKRTQRHDSPFCFFSAGRAV